MRSPCTHPERAQRCAGHVVSVVKGVAMLRGELWVLQGTRCDWGWAQWGHHKTKHRHVRAVPVSKHVLVLLQLQPRQQVLHVLRQHRPVVTRLGSPHGPRDHLHRTRLPHRARAGLRRCCASACPGAGLGSPRLARVPQQRRHRRALFELRGGAAEHLEPQLQRFLRPLSRRRLKDEEVEVLGRVPLLAVVPLAEAAGLEGGGDEVLLVLYRQLRRATPTAK